MIDREKVIIGLKHHLAMHEDEEQCVGCPYYDCPGMECIDDLYDDAMEIMRTAKGAENGNEH